LHFQAFCRLRAHPDEAYDEFIEQHKVIKMSSDPFAFADNGTTFAGNSTATIEYATTTDVASQFVAGMLGNGPSGFADATITAPAGLGYDVNRGVTNGIG
jgi:hypothetical protein